MAKEREKVDSETDVLEKEKVKMYGSFLEDRKLKVKPVESNGKWNGLLVAGQERKKEPFLFNKVKRSYQVPLHTAAQGGGVRQILDNQKRVLIKKYESSHPDGMTEQEFFEKELGVENLNPRLKKEDNFWRMDKRGRVTMTREGLTLNLNNAIDMLRYKILMANKRKVAPSYEERGNSLSYEFMIVNEDKMTTKRLEDAELQADAFAKFTELTKDTKKMIGFMKALGHTLPANYDNRWLKAEVLNVLQADSKNFLRIVNDPLFKEKIFVQEAIDAGALKKWNKNRYTTDGGVELGDLNSTINWLNDGDNQEARLRIKTQIEQAKRDKG
jgi:hypothetical protein